MKKKYLNPTILNVLRLWLVFAMLFQLGGTALAYTWTDKPDYSPGETVTIHGDNSDGAGYLADEPIFVEVWGPNGFHVSSEPDNPTADANGAWSWQLTLWDTEVRWATIPTPPPASRPTCRRAERSRMLLSITEL